MISYPLATMPRWVAWRTEQRKGKPTKVPYSPHGGMGKADDPATWGTRAEAEARAEKLVNGSGSGGVGIHLGDLDGHVYLAGVDLDSCINEEGSLASWAATILAELDTYAERSPSGRGIKAFFYVAQEDVRPFLDLIGVPPTGWGTKRGIAGHDGANHGPGVELYCSHRFFAITNNLWPGRPDRTHLLDRSALERLAAVIPRKTKEKRGRDNSDSAVAFRLGLKLRREGKSFEEMVAALQANAATAEWARTKGEADGGRHFQLIWDKVGKIVEEQPDDLIEELNKTYAVIRVVNRVAILNEHLDADGRPTFSLINLDSFKLWLANQKTEITTVDKNGAPAVTKVPVSALWLTHPRRRAFEGVTFAPRGAPLGYFNLWNGFAVTPSEAGSCERFKAHLKDNVCEDNAVLFNWVFGWFADIFQHPAAKCGTSIVLRGKMGVGKTIVGETFGHLLGLHYVQVADPRYVTGRFNAHLVRCLLFHCDEGFWAGDRVAEGKLKDLVTGKRHPIELKGFEVFFVPNQVRVFINGNPDWLVPAGMDERRFACLDVASLHKEDIPYFREIAEELAGGGYERLLWELLHFDLSTVDLRHIPKTDALLDQKIASLSPEDGWWLDILRLDACPNTLPETRWRTAARDSCSTMITSSTRRSKARGGGQSKPKSAASSAEPSRPSKQAPRSSPSRIRCSSTMNLSNLASPIAALFIASPRSPSVAMNSRKSSINQSLGLSQLNGFCENQVYKVCLGLQRKHE
jgi:hypothetical protein